MRRFALTLLVLTLVACPRQPSQPTPKAPSITGLPATMKLKQRTTTAIPGSDGRVSVSIDDITRGQVLVSVVRTPASNDSSALLGPMSMKSGDASTFQFETVDYALELSALDNELVGTDSATFTVRVVGAAAAKLTEAQKIDKLIESVGALQGATFIRNGDEHSAADAATHLRTKREAGGKDVATAELFIENAATRSSLSGKDYEIRFADGRTVRLADFLKEQLAKLNAS